MSQAVWQRETQLSPGPSSAQQAQDFVGHLLWQHHRDDLVADVQVVTGDLVGRLVAHASGAMVVALEEHPFCLVLTVRASVSLPAVLQTQGGGGLHDRAVPPSVRTFVEWGSDTDRLGGRSVWVMFALQPPTFNEWIAGG